MMSLSLKVLVCLHNTIVLTLDGIGPNIVIIMKTVLIILNDLNLLLKIFNTFLNS